MKLDDGVQNDVDVKPAAAAVHEEVQLPSVVGQSGFGWMFYWISPDSDFELIPFLSCPILS